MDYSGQNFDYNDNVYLITNMVPAPPAAPTKVATSGLATGTTTGVTVTWAAVTDPLLSGYTVYRSTTLKGTYVVLNATPTTATSYADTTAVVGTTYYYTVTATDSLGGVSAKPTGVAGTAAAAVVTTPVQSAVKA